MSDIMADMFSNVTTALPFDNYSTNYSDPDAMFIHPHWRQFDIENIPAYQHYLVGIFITIVGIGGVVGNFFVIWIFLR